MRLQKAGRRKRFLILPLFLISGAGVFYHGLAIRPGARKFHTPPATVSEVSAKVTQPATSLSDSIPTAPPFGSAESPAEIFAYFHSEGFIGWSEWVGMPRVLEVLGERLDRPIDRARTNDPHDRSLAEECMIRISILRGLARWDEPDVHNFYLHLLQSSGQPWLVQREALVRLNQSSFHYASERDRGELLALVDPRAIATAGMRDLEILERGIDAESKEH